MLHVELNFPELKTDTWAIESFVQDGQKYQRLLRKGIVMMVNTPDIVKDFAEFLTIAEGSVLINGLGMGMCNAHLLKKESITDITVIEYDEELVNFIRPLFSQEERCTILHADALTYEPPAGKMYDYVWHDIWTLQSSKNVAQIDFLKNKYAEIAKWQGAWREALVRAQYANDPTIINKS